MFELTWLGALPGPVAVGLKATFYWERLRNDPPSDDAPTVLAYGGHGGCLVHIEPESVS